MVRKRFWRYDWVLDLDIQGFFALAANDGWIAVNLKPLRHRA
jgi:hypothetical protein